MGLALTWPLWILIAAAIKLDSRGPVFFRQERLGKDGKPFQILKFRTMIKDAERPARSSPAAATRASPGWADFYASARLDELPQLYNILKGEMSFIGPRPEREVFIREFQQIGPGFAGGHAAPPTRKGSRWCAAIESVSPTIAIGS